MIRLSDLDTATLTEGYASGKFDPVEVVQNSLGRIDELDGALHAVYDRFDEEALAAAEASRIRWDNGTPLSPMDGVPVTLKENQAMRGRPTPWGSATTEQVPAALNSPVVDRMLSAGAVVLARTTMPELGMLSSGVSSLHEITRNPWNFAWSPGGSSSGAGAASAAGYAPVNLGSDIGGSVRLPASWCGVAGFKPTYARIPVDPPYPARTIGPMGRRVADIARSMTVLEGAHPADPWSFPAEGIEWTDLDLDISGLRVGVVIDLGDGAPVEPEVATVVRRAADVFAAAGAEVVEIGPYIAPGTIDLIDRFWRAGHWRKYKRMSPEQREKMLPFIAEWCRTGAEVTGEEALDAHDAQLTMARATLFATQNVDLVLSPVSPGAAFPAEWPMPSNDVSDAMAHIGFCVVYNMSGQPAACVNGGFTAQGSPVGVQIAACRHADRTALAAAAFFETARPEDAKRPWPQVSCAASV